MPFNSQNEGHPVPKQCKNSCCTYHNYGIPNWSWYEEFRKFGRMGIVMVLYYKGRVWYMQGTSIIYFETRYKCSACIQFFFYLMLREYISTLPKVHVLQTFQ